MAQAPVPEAEMKKCLDLVKKHGVSEAARRLGIPRATLQYRVRQAETKGEKLERPYTKPAPSEQIETPTFPADDLPIEDIIAFQAKRFEQRQRHATAKNWPAVKVKIDGPIGLMWFGDPHLGNDGCNMPLLLEHIALCNNVEGLFAANIGDTTDNWCGRLMRLYADNDVSRKTEHRLAKWFLTEAGINWLVWTLGNHDVWGDGSTILRLMNTTGVYMEDWQARFRLVFPNKRECRIHASHNFAGNSMWNSLHGLQKAAHMKAEAHLYVAGHTHNYALHQEESSSRDFTYWLARARGYKFIDSYSENMGHLPQKDGASILAIIDPYAKSDAAFMQCFADPVEGVEYLKWKRSRG